MASEIYPLARELGEFADLLESSVKGGLTFDGTAAAVLGDQFRFLASVASAMEHVVHEAGLVTAGIPSGNETYWEVVGPTDSNVVAFPAGRGRHSTPVGPGAA